MPLSDSLPRPFLIKAILRELTISTDLLQRGRTGLELAASRIADGVEFAWDVFAANDDPQPASPAMLARTREQLSAIREAAGAPSSPEDIGQETELPPPAGGAVRFPQPVNNLAPEDKRSSLIVLPGTRAAEETMKAHENREIAPIRPGRIGDGAPADGETPRWAWGELYSQVTLKTPDSVTVQPAGVAEPVQLDRTITANEATGIIKVDYTVAGQRESNPTTYGSSADIPMNIPVSVGHSFSVYDQRSLNFKDVVGEIEDRARTAFRPRQKGLVSNTPRTAETLEQLFSQVQRNSAERARQGEAYRLAVSPNFDSV